MFKSTLLGLALTLLLLFGISSDNSASSRAKQQAPNRSDPKVETVQKLVLSEGNVTIDLDRLDGSWL